MICTPTEIEGAYVIEIEPFVDERGMFARVFDDQAFRDLGLETSAMQFSVSLNPAKATLRGMHYQSGDHAEVKLIRCTQGAVYDVAIDLRPDSSSYCACTGVELTGDNGRALFVPPGFAHGFLTLVDGTDVFYHMGAFFQPEAARGLRYDDPVFSVQWPGQPVVISERDRTYPDFDLETWRLNQ